MKKTGKLCLLTALAVTLVATCCTAWAAGLVDKIYVGYDNGTILYNNVATGETASSSGFGAVRELAAQSNGWLYVNGEAYSDSLWNYRYAENTHSWELGSQVAGWGPIGAVTVSKTGTLYVGGNSSGPALFAYDGVNFGSKYGYGTVISATATPSGEVYFATDAFTSLWKTSYNGGAWSSVTESAGWGTINAIAVTSTGTIYVGLSDGYLCGWDGTNWSSKYMGIGSIKALATQSDGSVAVAGSAYQSVWFTKFNGSSWDLTTEWNPGIGATPTSLVTFASAPVPEPGSLLALGSGLIGLLAIRRRK